MEEWDQDPEHGVGAGLAHHAGEEHQHRRGGGEVGVPQPTMEGENRDLDDEGGGEEEEEAELDLGACLVLGEVGEVEGGGAGEDVLADDPDQHQQRADQREKDELQRRRERLSSLAPHPEQEVGWDQHRLPEDVEEDQVGAQEDARHAALHDQQESEEAGGPHLPERRRCEHRDQAEEGVEDHQPDADRVDAEVVVGLDLRYPAHLFDELVAVGTGIEAVSDVTGDPQRQRGGQDRDPLAEVDGEKGDQDAAEDRDQPDVGQHSVSRH